MIIQACLNGARPSEHHPRLPLSPDAIARDGAACVTAGAAELHVHPRREDGSEGLAAIDETIRAVRRACPGTLVGVSTGAWIEGNEERTKQCIRDWHVLPDYASVNLSEPDAPAVIKVLHSKGIGVEAGLATVADAERLVMHADRHRIFRILIEIEEQERQEALRVAEEIEAVIERADVQRPILLHGFDKTVWPLIERARAKRWSTRVGLEDGKHLPDGRVAADNAALVSSAVDIFRS